jgi:hypothetical protein
MKVLSGGWNQWEWEGHKGRRRANMVKTYVLMYENEKMRPVETILRMGGRRIKENDGGGEFNYAIL